ncbi:hypothetical protein L7F22_033846 [Adiantum nelumboides]|nr:hypothetical protein [Adiantum nelumboides]
MNSKRLSLTDIKTEFPRMLKKKLLKHLAAAINSANVQGKWANSSWGIKLNVQKKRALLSDIDRFKVIVARIKRSSIVKL